MKLEKFIAEFPITVYSNLEKYNDTVSKARCRIFYKGANRNGSYITDEFAEQLVKTLPYTPVKGIYDEFNEDYTDHGESRDLGRIYGVVPVDNNFAWEQHADEDGVIREYACTDILLYTAIYKEAGEILGKAQSMELYDGSIKGDWKVISGHRYFVFTEGCFLGLQALGEDVEPCFEGSAFFSLIQRMEEALQKIEQYNLDTESSIEGGNIMSVINYRLSDREKFDAIWMLLNENYNEENNWAVDYEICDIYDDYALVRNFAENCYERVYYEKDDNAETLHVCGKKKCHVLDVDEEEYTALQAIRALAVAGYELSADIYQKGIDSESVEAEYAEKTQEFELKITELESANATLLTEKEELTSNFASLQEETEKLQSYKLAKETEEKQEVINKYSTQLDEEIIKNYTEKIAEFTKVDLEKELAFELVQSKPAIFSPKNNVGFIPQEDTTVSGIEAILEKYRK